MTFRIFEKRLDREAQEKLLEDIRAVIKEAPLLAPVTKNGQKFNLRLTNCGTHGWLSDEKGYRYEAAHPETKKPWPAMPQSIHDLAVALAKESGFSTFRPEVCLINHYEGTGRLGMHQDKDELDFSAPIVSVSLGDECIFQFGGVKKTDPVKDYRLKSGDCVVWGGDLRLAYHGVKKIVPGSSTLLPNGGRYNLTVRQVTL